MKFLCPSCKAKYQIADEKVAGRSVRMKCRKCGFMIQVTSAMAAPSGAGSEPPEAGDSLESTSAPPPAEPEKASGATGSPAPRAVPNVAGRSLVSKPTLQGTAPASKATLQGTGPAPRPPAPRASSPLPKPATPPPRASAPRAAAVGMGAALASAPKPEPKPEPLAAELPSDFDNDDEVTRMADAGALAGAFTQAFGGGGADTESVEARLSMPGDEWFVGINGVPVGPIRLSELRSKAAAGGVNKESLVWRDGFEDWRPLKTYPELVAIVEEGVSSARASLTPFTPAASEVGSRVGAGLALGAADVAASPSAVTGSAVVTDDIAALVPPRRGTSPLVWVAMVIAIALGLTMGFVLFGGKQPGETKIVEKIVEKEVPVKGDNGAPVAANDNPGTPAEDVKGAPKRPTGTGKTPSGASTAEAGKPNTGLSGLTGLSGIGPSGSPNTGGPSGSSNSGAQLDGGQIQSTVSRYTGSVKRRCWQPALDARAKDAPMTAKVTVQITVGGTGTVQNASTSGDPRGYTGLANCIASSVRSWQFPASGGTTIANVPFVFAGQ